ncbi:hypothetical protein [Kineosporia sp. NBRC 101731]|uniref:hypothetical protein n=1 Tax=Kineosporia sp. NBRC 101731 TaxID=3032199 RepID=UPI0024A046EB|nr:hypothetical protein [Kineosporia sp. NBRC 101731]GLY31520.1 hypothetical protein Kisp02_48850 [Kineosporia sp. NBRC 101731]
MIGRPWGRGPRPTSEQPTWTDVAPLGGLRVERYENVLLATDGESSPSIATRIIELRQVAEHLASSDQTPTVLIVTPSVLATRLLLEDLAGRPEEFPPAEVVAELRIIVETGTTIQGELRAAAHRLADGRGLRVVISPGRLLHVPGRTLFPLDGTGHTTWQQFVPGHPQPISTGPWFFTARWRSAPALLPPAGLIPGLRVLPVPSGVVLVPDGIDSLPVDDVVYSVPVDPQHPLVVVHWLLGPGIEADQVAGYLALLPAELRQQLRLAPAGLPPTGQIWQEIVDVLEEEVVALTGLPLLFDQERTVSVVALGSDGQIEVRWQPVATHLRWCPALGESGQPAKVVANRGLGRLKERLDDDGVTGEESVQMEPLDADWAFEAVPGGVLLRRVNGGSTGHRPMDPAGPLLLVDGLGEMEALADKEFMRHQTLLWGILREVCAAEPRTVFLESSTGGSVPAVH